MGDVGHRVRGRGGDGGRVLPQGGLGLKRGGQERVAAGQILLSIFAGEKKREKKLLFSATFREKKYWKKSVGLLLGHFNGVRIQAPPNQATVAIAKK